MQMSMEFCMNMHTYYVVIRSIYVRMDRTERMKEKIIIGKCHFIEIGGCVKEKEKNEIKRVKNVLLLLCHHSRRCRRRGSRRFQRITHTRQMLRHIDLYIMRRTCMYFDVFRCDFCQSYLLE